MVEARNLTKLGEKVTGFTPPPWPNAQTIEGRYVRLEKYDAARHAKELFLANRVTPGIYDYLLAGPFETQSAYDEWAQGAQDSKDPYFFTLIDAQTGEIGGVQSFMRINPKAGSIELGNIAISSRMQRTRMTTEAFFLAMEWAFTAGYRRFEWKCNALNMPSRRAAQRLGLSYEGVFRQALIVHGYNRDTAWFAAIDKEWPALEHAFTAWLEPENFDENGQQKITLGSLTAPILAMKDPLI